MASNAEVAAAAYDAGRLVGGRFRIEGQLARGGMGAVYRAYDERAGRGVALKQLLLPRGAHDSLIEVQFEREFYTLSQLAHPSIIEVYDYGVEPGGPYYTMELLQGQDLRQRGKLPWRQACAVLCDVASSLAILHSRRLLHRDISARNVFCSEGGRAKLIDFGVMTPMGVSKQVVGTPPFVPPESLQMQALDGRADLYSLGALAYFLLSGAYAYPARTLSELTTLLRVPPPPLRQYESDVPEALEALIMQLLQLDRSARPHTAAEVMERLSGIAGLSLGERVEVGKAYLVTPVLTGRDEALERSRSELRAGRGGEGATLLIDGARGAGRSRVLDAAVLEAKLLGAMVLRADAADAAEGDYGVARALCMQLHAALPEGFEQDTRASLRPSASLRPLLTEVRQAFRSGQRADFVGERRHVHAALNEWFMSVAAERHLVIAVDDVDRIDEPSAAVLAALAHGARRRRLNLLLTAETGTTPNAALGLLRQLGRPVALAPLDAAQVEQLLRSLFGDVPHVAALSASVFGSSGGVPGATMTLVEHLVESGVARYEAGTWALPAQLHAEQLPRSLSLAQSARLQRLTPDARGLAEAISLIDAPGVTPPHYTALTEHRDNRRTYAALQALLASGVLVVAGDRHRFSAVELRSLLREELSEARRHALHARIADVLVGGELEAQRPMHMLLGGREREAIAQIQQRYARGAVRHGSEVELLERAVQAAARLGLPLAIQLELQLQRLYALSVVGDRERFLRHGPELLQRALQASGLFDFDALGNGSVAERMAEARARAQQRYDALPEAERGWAADAMPDVLTRIYGSYLSMTSLAQELSVVEQLPPLGPLLSVWPALSVMQVYVDIACAMQRGHHGLVVERARGLLEYMQQHQAELPDALLQPVRLGQLFTLGLFAATSGRGEARELVAEHEQLPVHRVNAWRVRMVYELMLGNVQGAAQCQRRAELLFLQDSGQAQGPSVTNRVELLAHIYSDDLIGVKRVIDTLGDLAARYPGWQSTLAIARCQYRRLRGDPAGAFEALQPVLQSTLPGYHMDWWLVAYSHVQVMSELGRPAEAASYGRRCIEIWTEGNFSPIDYGLRQVTAEALLRAGDVAEARAMIDAYIDMHVAAGTHGLRLGLAYETRTRVAIAQQDEPAVQIYSRLCAQEYKGGRHFGLLTKYSRLLRDADAGGISVNTGLRHALDPSVVSSYADASQTLQSMLMGCVDATELSHTGLRALLQSSDVECGYLFLLRSGRLQRMAASESADAETPGLLELLEQCLHDELEHEVATGQDEPQTKSRLPQCWRDARGREFGPVLLSGKHGGHSVAFGMAAVQTERDRRPVIRRVLIETLCQSLLAEHAADPIRLR